MKKEVLVTIGMVVGLGAGAATYHHFRNKRRDRVAAELLREITKYLNPATAGILGEPAFDIYYKSKVFKKVRGKIMVLQPAFAKKYAKEIHGAWGFWDDDENVIYGVFRKMKDKVWVSILAKAYQDTYHKNLIDVLYDKLSETEIEKVLKIVRRLPDYRAA